MFILTCEIVHLLPWEYSGPEKERIGREIFICLREFRAHNKSTESPGDKADSPLNKTHLRSAWYIQPAERESADGCGHGKPFGMFFAVFAASYEEAGL